MSTLRVNTIQNVAGSGDPAINGAAKAWVNFNGTGTVAIRASFNVSSITDNGVGVYRVNFTNAMPDTNYCAQIFASNTGANRTFVQQDGNNNSNFGQYVTTSIAFYNGDLGNLFDSPFVSVAIFR